MKWKDGLLAIRPKTLTAALIPIFVGTSLSYAFHQKAKLSVSFFAFVSAIFIQIGTNLVNDASDFEKGADTCDRIGPKRVTQSGIFSSRQIWGAAFFCFLFAILFALPLVYVGGFPIFWIGCFSILAGYAYTAGPFPLAYMGLGDLFVLIFFGWIAVCGTYYLNTQTLDFNSGVAGFQIGMLATILIAINNLRDIRTDQSAHKKTLAVRFGITFARWEILLFCLCPFLAGFYWLYQGLFWAALLPLFTFPLALMICRNIFRVEPSERYNQFLGLGALLHLSFGVLLSLGFYLS